MFSSTASSLLSPGQAGKAAVAAATVPTSVAPAQHSSLAAQIKAALNRPSGPYLADKIADLTRLLAPHVRAGAHYGVHYPHQVKDLDSAFLLVLGDVFGSMSVHAPKYGPGWCLGQISRHRSLRDFNAALTFLGSGGIMMLRKC